MHSFSSLRRSADSGPLIRQRSVLAQDQLELYAQKIIPLRNRSERTGYELLLLRALDEEHGNCAPGELLAAAQRYQMESTVDLWVVEHALAAAARHCAALHASDVHLSLNISAQALTDETFLKGLPVDRVKIDGSFISDLLSNAHSVATVRAIVSLAREL